MASYQQGNDYQTYQSNPYQMPTQQIIAAVQQRNQYWDSAASNLKSAYQNYLGLDLTRADNHEKLNQLMQGVNENLAKVSKTDLSLGENYGKALDIFDPIIKDDNIMGDNAITKHYKQEFGTAQSYRIKDNGKEYSDTNVQDLSNHLKDFAQDPNAANWRQHYSTRAFYTPYTDVSAEVRQVAKDFKPDTKSLSTPMFIDPKTGQITTNGGGGGLDSMTGRILTQTDKSILSSQYRAFMDAHLSDKAKNQLGIEGRVKYHDNPGALVQDYSAYNQNKMDNYKEEIERLKGVVSNATPAQKEVLTDQINRYEGQIKDLNIENTKMKAGDLSNVTPYKDRIGAAIHTNNYLDYLSKASAQRNIDIKYTPDQVWKTMYQEDNENKRFNVAKQLQWDIAMEHNKTQLILKGMGKDGKLIAPLSGIPGYGIADTTNDTNFGQDEYNKLQQGSAADFSKSVDQFNKKVAVDTGIDPNDTKVPQAQRDAAVQQFFSNPNNAYDKKQYYEAAQKRSLDQAIFNSVDQYVNDNLKNQHPGIFNYKKDIINGISQGQSVRLIPVDGKSSPISMNLSADDIKQLVNNQHPTMKLDNHETTSSIFTGPGMSGAPVTTNERVITMGGRQYKYNMGILGETLNKLEQGSVDFDKTKKELLNQQMTRISGIENLYQNDKNPYYNAVHQLVARAVIGSGSIIKPEDIVLTQKDKTGGIYFKVQGDSKIDRSDVQLKVEQAKGRYIKADDQYYIPGDRFGELSKQNSFTDPKLAQIQTLVDFRSSANPNDRFSTPPVTWGNRNFSFKVDIQDGHPVYRIVDPVSTASFGSTTQGVPYNTLEEAAARANFLGTLTNDQYTNLVRTIGNVPDYQPK